MKSPKRRDGLMSNGKTWTWRDDLGMFMWLTIGAIIAALAMAGRI